MRYWRVNNKFIMSRFFTGWMYSLLMIMVPPVLADGSAVNGEGIQNPALRVAEQSNPWALPRTKESYSGSQPEFQQPYDGSQQYRSAPQNAQNQDRQGQYGQDQPAQYHDSASQYQPANQWQPQSQRFVSPEFLESLKHQQQQYQVMPENQQYRQPVPGQFMQMQPGSGFPGQSAYGYPSYGMGSASPRYDTPVISPMHVPSFGMNNYKKSESSEPGESFETDDYNVFNPFTFLPNGGSR